MHSTYRIDTEKKIVYKDHQGRMSVDDEINFLTEVLGDTKFRPGMSCICNLTEATIDWTLADLDKFRAFVSKNKHLAGKSKWALIVGRGVTAITAKLFSVLNESFEDMITVKLFSSAEEAEEWVVEADVTARQPE